MKNAYVETTDREFHRGNPRNHSMVNSSPVRSLFFI